MIWNRADRERRLRIFESNYGRDGGWFLEYQGRRIAVLTEPRFEDMFWYSYKIEPLTEDPEANRELHAGPERWLSLGFVYRSREFGETVEALPAGRHFRDNDRVLMRRLYLMIGEPSILEKLLLWWRGRLRSSRNAQRTRQAENLSVPLDGSQ